MTPDLLTPPKEMDSLSMEGLESAPGGWFDCEVQKAGPAEDGTIFIGLRHTGGAFNCWFSATPTMKREMLATALAHGAVLRKTGRGNLLRRSKHLKTDKMGSERICLMIGSRSL